MKAIIRDRVYLSGLTSDQSAKITKALTIRNPKYAEAQKQGRSTWGIDRNIELFESIPGGLIVPRGVPLEHIVGDTVQDDRHSHSVEIDSIIEPSAYQERALRLMVAAGGRNQIIVSKAIKSSRIVGTAILTGTIAHSEALNSLVKEHGVNALLLHGQLPKKVRDQRMQAAPDSQQIYQQQGFSVRQI